VLAEPREMRVDLLVGRRARVERLLAERDTIRTKVEAMLDAIAVLDPEAAEVMRR
jgi:hypothetical protein